MRILGIITEYNPFHYGHLYHLKKAKDKTQSDAVICVMNGNFVQRGLPALIDKWARVKMALANGIDLVIELPVIYGIRSAEYFAQGAVQLLTATGIVDYLVFGSENGKIEQLRFLTKVLANEDPFFKNRLKKYLTKGFSFPKARESALIDYLTSQKDLDKTDILEITKAFNEPNNILGIEYLKAIDKLKSPIIPLTIKRSRNNYHSKELSVRLSSATAIREKIYQGKKKTTKKYLPESSWRILNEEFKQGKGPVNKEYLGLILLFKLRQLKNEKLREYAEINNGLENRIITAAHTSGTLNQLIDNIKNKGFTQTRIQRNLLHILFGLNAAEFTFLDRNKVQYLRILGFNKKGEEILKKLKANSSLPIITQPKNFLNSIDLDSNNPLIKSLSYDILATDIYSLLYPNPEKRLSHLDFTIPIIKN